MVKKYELLAVLTLALSSSAFAVVTDNPQQGNPSNMVIKLKPGMSANNMQQGNPMPVVSQPDASPVNACPAKIQYDVFKIVDTAGRVLLPVVVKMNGQDVKRDIFFWRTSNNQFWNIDAGAYKIYMETPGNPKDDFSGLIFDSAEVNDNAKPAYTKCTYKYTLPLPIVKGSSAITGERTRRISLTYNNVK